MQIEIEGIVIKQNPYKEKDAMVSVITKDGIVSFLARSILSISSKNKSSCLPFSYSIFTLSSKQDKLTLKQGRLVRSYYHFYESLEKLSSINLIGECINKFVDEDDTNLFKYLVSYLELLDRGFDEATLTTIVLAQIIKSSGYSLEYNSCVCCQNKKNIIAVDYTKGGFICKNCIDDFSIKKDKEYLKTFRYVFMITADNMAHYVLDSAISYKIITEFCEYLSNSFDYREIKALEIYNQSKK